MAFPFQRPSSPPWSIQPSNQWSIIEIKDGVEVAEHNLTAKLKNLSSKMILFGRAADQVDVELQHASISRFHARIAFDKEGETPWLRDLCSAHGVFVNKRRLPASTVGREETMSKTAGSRGVTIYPGDIIQFGASSRFFCVVGPEEFSRNNPAHQKPIVQHHEANTDIIVQNNEVDDAVYPLENDETSGEHEAVLSDDKIPDNLRPEWEKIKGLHYKMENIENESERIQAKGDTESLSTGQIKQLERNNERIAALRDQIHSKEAELYQKVFSNKSYNRRKSENDTVDFDEDEDSYFDRTNTDQKNIVELDKGGETAETLTVKWNDIHKRKAEIASKLMILNEKEIRLTCELNACDEQDNVFFIENDLNLVLDTKNKLQQEQTILLNHLEEIEEMIHVANPKLKKSNDGLSWLDQTETSKPNYLLESSVETSKDTTTKSKEVPLSENVKEQSLQQSTMSPPPKRLKSTTVSGTAGTLALLATSTNSQNEQQKHNEVQQERPVDAGRPVVEYNHERPSINLEQQHDTWQAPKDQDGSGRTKLNAKFSGRY